MTMTIIIDGRGRLREDILAFAAADMAVKDKGWVTLRRYGRRAVEVRIRPGIVKPRALLRTVRWLDDDAGDRCVVMSWSDDWRTSVRGGRAAAIEYLVGLATDAQSTRRGDFQARRHGWNTDALDPSFGRIQAAWRAARGVEDRALMEAVREASCGRYLQVLPENGASRLVMHGVGQGYSLYSRGWKSFAIGGRFEDMPDYAYAQWAARGYREAYRERQPLLEDIVATVQLPGLGNLRLAYRRAILPLGGGDHPELLLGATLGQTVTRLDLEPGDELGDVLQ
jgi:hypothetical protein